MSSDLLAEFDSFYKSPNEAQTNQTPASNDLFSLNNTGGGGQSGQGGSVSQWQSSTAKPNNDIWGGMTSFPTTVNIQQATAAPQNDIWGAFETPAVQSQGPTLAPLKQDYGGSFTTRVVDRTINQNKPGIVRRPTLDLFSHNIHDLSESTTPKPTMPAVKPESFPHPRPAPVTKGSFGEVLFDAADELEPGDDDDEFGDFETGTSDPLPQPPPSQSVSYFVGATALETKPAKRPANLLSTTIDLSGGTLPYPKAPKSPSFQERNPFAELGIATKQVSTTKKDDKPNSPSPVTAWPTYEPNVPKSEPYVDSPAPDNALDDGWGDFADLPPETPSVQPPNTLPGIEADAWAWDVADQVSAPTPATVETPPPTNIPPPSVLLALFPPLFNLPQSTLFKAVAQQPFSLKNRIISDPSTIDFLRAYLLIATVAARVIAGRKLRWKRDTILSQAMKIGPAAAGGKGGMKLAGVDKAEITREDREAADVVRVWKDQLGRLRSAIAVANSSVRDASSHLAIPDISEAMYVKTQEAGLTAPKPCIICGLKREERINKVDVEVEDSFGEWWTEHWGHRACRNFWLEHESKLKAR